MSTETSIDVMSELGILEPHEVAQLLKLRHSTVLDLSRRGVLPAFKIGKHWRYRRADLEEWIGTVRRPLGGAIAWPWRSCRPVVSIGPSTSFHSLPAMCTAPPGSMPSG